MSIIFAAFAQCMQIKFARYQDDRKARRLFICLPNFIPPTWQIVNMDLSCHVTVSMTTDPTRRDGETLNILSHCENIILFTRATSKEDNRWDVKLISSDNQNLFEVPIELLSSFSNSLFYISIRLIAIPQLGMP